MTAIEILAFAIPALFGAVSAVVLGHRQVRVLRERTGDDSALTKVLSGDFLRHDRGKRKAA